MLLLIEQGLGGPDWGGQVYILPGARLHRFVVGHRAEPYRCTLAIERWIVRLGGRSTAVVLRHWIVAMYHRLWSVLLGFFIY